MTKYHWLDEPETSAIGLILVDGKIRISYEPIGDFDDDVYDNYNELINILPNTCYIVFDE